MLGRTALVLLLASCRTAAPAPATLEGLALTPPMGWNSWNSLGLDISEDRVLAVADTLELTGLAELGYTHINIDDGWHGERDSDGVIHENTQRFSRGMGWLADAVHERGFQLGIYSDAGEKTCGGFPGSEGFQAQDARQYAAWGIDYLKYDWCYAQDLDAPLAYAQMRRAIVNAGRPMVFSACEWGSNAPWTWAPGVAHLWRTTMDIQDCQSSTEIGANCWPQVLDQNAEHFAVAGPDGWNDPDMLIVGLHGNGAIPGGGATDLEYRSHFSLWCMMAAPLIIGADLTQLDPYCLETLSNAEMIAVDQDALGKQGQRIRTQGGLELWVKELENGDKAVLLHNRSDAAVDMSVTWEELGYAADAVLDVRDLWTHADLGGLLTGHHALVDPHGVVVWRLSQAQ